MKYKITSIPDSIDEFFPKGKMKVILGRDFYNYYEGHIEYIKIDSFHLKINHKKGTIEANSSNQFQHKMDINKLKRVVKRMNAKIGVLSSNRNEVKYFFQFPNTDSSACVMTMNKNTGWIKQYKYKVWAEDRYGDIFLKYYHLDYSSYRVYNKNPAKRSNYIQYNKNGMLIGSGRCQNYKVSYKINN